MIYDILAIFNDAELAEVESTLSQFTLMNQATKNQLIRAVEDYRYLVSSLFAARGLSQQVILFLLNPDSCTLKGATEFLISLEYWVMILENEEEQRMYADILRYSYYETDEILTLRSNLISILQELEEVKRTLKKTKNSQDSLVKNKTPWQLDDNCDDYVAWMMNYGSEYEKEDSSFNIVPDLKGKLTDPNHPHFDSFAVYVDKYYESPSF